MPRPEQVQPIPPDPGEEVLEKEAEQQQQQEKEAEGEAQPGLNQEQKEEAATKRRKKLKSSKSVRPFPAPAVRYYHDDHQSQKGQPSEFFKYWKRLCSDAEFRQRVVVYIYRAWPAMLDGKRQVAKVYDEALTPEDLLRQYGCGDYVLRLNDTGSNGLNVTNCQIRNLGARQLNEFPPVLNLEDLDFDDKSNQSYLLWARSRGMLTPEQEKRIRSPEQKREEGEDMANAEAIKQLASTVDRITDKVITVASKEKDGGGGGGLPEKLLDLVTAASASATQSAAQIMQESVKQVLELQRQNANPLQNLKDVANTLKELIPKNDAANEVVSKLIDQDKRYTETIFQIQHQRIESLEKMLEKFLSSQLSQPQTAPSAVPAAAQKSPLDMLKEMAAVKEELREILGIEDREEPGWMKYAPLIAQAVSALGVYLANAMHNLAVARTGQGKPEPPPQPQQAAPAAPPTMPENAAPQQSQEDAMRQFHQFLQRIERPLLRSFNEGESGADFAAKLIELTDDGLFGPQVSGRQIYDAVLEYGQDVVSTLIKTYPPIWSVVSQTPQKWEKFLDDFFRADEIWAAEEGRNE